DVSACPSLSRSCGGVGRGRWLEPAGRGSIGAGRGGPEAPDLRWLRLAGRFAMSTSIDQASKDLLSCWPSRDVVLDRAPLGCGRCPNLLRKGAPASAAVDSRGR